MFEPDTTLKLNLATLALAVIVFGYIFIATRVQSTGPTGVILTQEPGPAPSDPGSATPSAILQPTATIAPTSTPTVLPTATPTETTTPVPPTATATVEPVILHTVAPGEVLSAIALRYGVTVEAISAANALDDPNQLEVGQILRIPVPATPIP